MRQRGLLGSAARLPTAFAIAAVAAAVALPVVLLSVGGGVATHELQSLENSGYSIAVSAAGLHGISGAHAVSASIDTLPGVAAASPVLSGALDIFVSNRAPIPLLAEGVIPRMFGPTEGPELRGLFPNPLPLGDPGDTQHFANGTYSGPVSAYVLLSSPFANAEGIGVGQNVTLSPSTNMSQGMVFRVSATFGVPPAALGPTAAFAAVLPLSDLQVLSGEARAPAGQLLDAADTVQVALSGSGSTNPATVEAVASAIAAAYPYYGVNALTDQAAQLEGARSILDGFYLALSSVGLTVGLLFVLLVMLRRVDAERKWFGVRRAIGESPLALARLTLTWAAVLAGSGVAIGTAGGYIVVWSLSTYAAGSVQIAASLAIFDPLTLLLLGTGVVGLALLAGLAAWRRVLSLSIPEVLR